MYTHMMYIIVQNELTFNFLRESWLLGQESYFRYLTFSYSPSYFFSPNSMESACKVLQFVWRLCPRSWALRWMEFSNALKLSRITCFELDDMNSFHFMYIRTDSHILYTAINDKQMDVWHHQHTSSHIDTICKAASVAGLTEGKIRCTDLIFVDFDSLSFWTPLCSLRSSSLGFLA